MLIDIMHNITPVSIFTDVPHSSAKRIYNLILAPVMIDIKPGGEWIILPMDRKGGKWNQRGDILVTIEKIYL